MTFQPVVPLGGYVGWRFLQNTLERQQETFNNSAVIQRDTAYFRENIGAIQTAEDLVNDRRLLSVALGAFGLDDDLNNRFFMQKILESAENDDEALANRLTDPRYSSIAQAFGFGEAGLPRTGLSTFADEIIARYEVKQFEKAVGEQNGDLRAALNFDGGLADILDENEGRDAQWYAIMGSPPVRRVFEFALGLPTSIGAIDVELQLEQFQSRAEATFGSREAADFADPEVQEKLIRLFLIRSEASNFGAFSSGSVALTLLQNA